MQEIESSQGIKTAILNGNKKASAKTCPKLLEVPTFSNQLFPV
jgi:hypothetical protein